MKSKSPRSASELEETFALHCKVRGLAPEREHQFHPSRKWKFDFAFVDRKVAIECEGGMWVNGRHSRGSGAVADMEKYNAAAALGWFIFRFDILKIRSGHAIDLIDSVLKNRS